MKKLFFFCCFLLLLSVFASTNVGNGGILFACDSPDYKPLSLLEFVEAKLLWQLPISAEFESIAKHAPADESRVIARVIERIAKGSDFLRPEKFEENSVSECVSFLREV